ncbi:MAG: 8-oxo-dGTP diphosphatase [Bradymonadia bacterium]|jgi:8-oxo-dGTP diphosphatase
MQPASMLSGKYEHNAMSDDSTLDEQAWLATYDADAFDRPSVAVDVAMLSAFDGALHALVLRRDQYPFKGAWSLPGGFVRIDESLEDAATRLLRDKAALQDVFVEQLFTFGGIQRDPRTRVIAVAYYALVDRARFHSALDAVADLELARLTVPWAGEAGGPVTVVDADEQPMRMGFDHPDILGMAVKRIRGKLDYSPIGFQLLPRTFTLRALQAVHETILARPLNKDSFRRRMLATGLLDATGRKERAVGHRPAELYRFNRASAV